MIQRPPRSTFFPYAPLFRSGTAARCIEDQLLSITESQAESAFAFAAIISIALALWGVSGAFRSIMEAMNVMYEVGEDRPAWKVYGISVFISLAVVGLMITAFGIVIFRSEEHTSEL